MGGVPLRNNPFRKRIPKIQTTGPHTPIYHLAEVDLTTWLLDTEQVVRKSGGYLVMLRSQIKQLTGYIISS